MSLLSPRALYSLTFLLICLCGYISLISVLVFVLFFGLRFLRAVYVSRCRRVLHLLILPSSSSVFTSYFCFSALFQNDTRTPCSIFPHLLPPVYFYPCPRHGRWIAHIRIQTTTIRYSIPLG